MPTLFFTGFPGFLASALLPRVLTERSDHEAVCLVEPRFLELAQQRVAGLDPGVASRVTVIPGDITRGDLGLEDRARWTACVDEVFHLAALYDLNVPRAVGLRINLEGTRYVLRFAAECADLKRFQYVSTCYVSGRHPGVFRESDLDVGQSFNNHYEETKFLAEVEVQQAGLPSLIYRPGIVVGDSRTGATLKYDGPYPVVRWLLRQPRFFALMPQIGDPRRTRINLVPQDFVVDAIAQLSTHEAPGKVYQLADPNCLTVAELLRALGRICGRRVVSLPLPLGLARWSLKRLGWIARFSGFSPAMVDYFVHPTVYSTDNAQAALAPAGIACPYLLQYLDTLVDYVRRHPHAPVG